MKLKLDLHDVYNRGDDIERSLRAIIDEAVQKKAPLVEIIPGKGSGQLKKRVLRFLDRKEIKALYDRVEGLPQLREPRSLPMEVTRTTRSRNERARPRKTRQEHKGVLCYGTTLFRIPVVYCSSLARGHPQARGASSHPQHHLVFGGRYQPLVSSQIGSRLVSSDEQVHLPDVVGHVDEMVSCHRMLRISRLLMEFLGRDRPSAKCAART